MPDARAAEFVARFDDPLVGEQTECLLPALGPHLVEFEQNLVRRLARAVERRRVDRHSRVQLRTLCDIPAGRLRHASPALGEVEVREAFVQQMVWVVHLAVTYEVDGGGWHSGLLACIGHTFACGVRPREIIMEKLCRCYQCTACRDGTPL